MEHPTFKEIVELEEADRVSISKNGKYIAFTTKVPNLEKNVYENKCYIYIDRVLVKTFIHHSIISMKWFRKGCLIFLSECDKINNMYIYDTETDLLENIIVAKINCYDIYENQNIVYCCNEKILYYYCFDTKITNEILNANGYFIRSFLLSDKCKSIYLHCVDINKKNYVNKYKLDNFITPEEIVFLPSELYDIHFKAVNPTDNEYYFEVASNSTFYANREIVSIKNNLLTNWSKKYDIEFNFIKKIEDKIYVFYINDVNSYIGYFDSDNMLHTINDSAHIVTKDIDIANNGDIIAICQGPNEIHEVYTFHNNNFCIFSNLSKQIHKWEKHNIKKISWFSKDGLEIHGILRYNSSNKMDSTTPVLVVLHGGPKDCALKKFVSDYKLFAPYFQLLKAGFIILEPNYRGSVGRGKPFLEANVNSLGYKDLWDIEAGVNYLIKEKLICKNRIFALGWSQGGFIAAYLCVNSRLFRAICIGAPISDWKTYYQTTDIPNFTTSYLSGKPEDNLSIYQKCSVISSKPKYFTPNIIFHGIKDKRVPIINSHKLKKYFDDNNISSNLYVLNNIKHRVTNPKEGFFVLTKVYSFIRSYM